ncbi:MAG: hypothetical protein HUK23_07295, partial [Sphaerochaetaceae bacterium]|nr:hypothetical protein [Sphaerochaetaceae bacterium]
MFNFKTAFRYAFSKTRGQRSTSIMIIFGIAAGLIALLVISAVMNGLQVAQLDQLRNLESFDLIINSENLTKEQINNIEGVESAFNFLETNILIVDKTSGKSASSRARAYDQNIFTDSRMSQSFYFLTEVPVNFDGVLISYTTMNNLNIRQNHDIEITFLKRGKTATIVPYTTSIGISGFFSTRLTEFSSSNV